VLSGVFSDEGRDLSRGSYLSQPQPVPGIALFSQPAAWIFVKLISSQRVI